MRIDILTLFPASFTSVFASSIIQKAKAAGQLEIHFTNLRDFGLGAYQQVDDTPYGGGAGMVIRADVAARAVQSLELGSATPIINFSPKGKPLTQHLVEDLAHTKRIVLFNAHYEGVDQRFIDKYITTEISIGDYILSGGESASIVVVDAIARLLPNVLGNQSSTAEESFSIRHQDHSRLLEYPHYTKPAEFEGLSVPEVLLSGDHKRIEQWRAQQALTETKQKRPDLLAKKD